MNLPRSTTLQSLVLFCVLGASGSTLAELDDFSASRDTRSIDDFPGEERRKADLDEIEAPRGEKESQPGPGINLNRNIPLVTESSYRVTGSVDDRWGVAVVEVNGEEAELDEGGNFAADVLLKVGENHVVVRATNVRRQQSEATLQITRKPGTRVVRFDDLDEKEDSQLVIEGQYHALLIGVETYPHKSLRNLSKPIDDAEALSRVLMSEYTFDEENVHLLRNPTRAELISKLDELSRQVTERDNLLIFYAGHGFWDEQFEQGYWLPADARKSTREAWIANGTIRDYVRGIGSKHTLLVSDACFSGGIFRTRKAFDDAPPSVRKLYELPSRKAMTSGSLTEVPDRSVFVKYLLKQLSTNKDAFVTAESLFSRFRTAVINNSPLEQVPQYGEIHQAGDEGGDFLFVRR